MSSCERGVILRNFSSSPCKFSVLTQSSGKILVVVLDQRQAIRLRPGMVIVFWIKRMQAMMVFVERVELMYMPNPQALADVYWLSHLLELCYFFIPLHQPSSEYWSLIVSSFFLIEQRDGVEESVWETVKRLYVGTLLTLLGFFPSDELIACFSVIQPALEQFVDFTQAQKVEFFSTCVQVARTVPTVHLDRWLLQCIQTHPRINMFKTVAFVYNTPLQESR